MLFGAAVLLCCDFHGALFGDRPDVFVETELQQNRNITLPFPDNNYLVPKSDGFFEIPVGLGDYR